MITSVPAWLSSPSKSTLLKTLLFLLQYLFVSYMFIYSYMVPSQQNTEYPRDLFWCQSSEGVWGNSPRECVCQGCHYPHWDQIEPLLPENPDLKAKKRKSYIGYQTFRNTPKIDCENMKILILIMTSVGNFRDRHLIRLTWGREEIMKRISGSIVFIIGDFDNSELQKKIDEESERYGDILQGKFEEDYHKLAFKSMSAFHWSKHFCPKIPWIVKTDDDTVNSIESLQEVLQAMDRDNLTNTIACASKTDPVHRKGSSEPEKWHVSWEEYPGYYYPTNCQGTFYVMSSNVRNRLYQAFLDRNETIFKIDDVFITGILAKEAGDITHRDIGLMVETSLDINNIYSMITGPVRFGHLPDHGPMAGRLRFWLWQKLHRHGHEEI